MNDMHSFSRDKQRAIAEMLDMNKKALNRERLPQQNATHNTHKPLKNLSDNSGLTISSDGMLIIGLILILSEDCRDMWLFLALMYILM